LRNDRKKHRRNEKLRNRALLDDVIGKEKMEFESWKH